MELLPDDTKNKLPTSALMGPALKKSGVGSDTVKCDLMNKRCRESIGTACSSVRFYVIQGFRFVLKRK